MSHCPRCTSEVPEASRFCGQCGSDVTPMDAATATGIGRLSPSDTLDDARFLPGRTVFVDNLLEQT